MKRHLIGVLGSMMLLCLTTAAFAGGGTEVSCNNNYGGPDRDSDYIAVDGICWHIEVKCEKDMDSATFNVGMSYESKNFSLNSETGSGSVCTRGGGSTDTKQEVLKCEFFGGAKVEASIKPTDQSKCNIN